MRNLVFWGLFPFALPQAIRTRKSALRLPPPSCETVGICRAPQSSGAPLRVLAIGDSVIRGVGVEHLRDAYVGQAVDALSTTLSRPVEWAVHGRSGARAEHLLNEYLPALPETPADVILLSVGVNDITGMTALRTWRARLGTLLDGLREHSPSAVIGVAGIPPLGQFPLLPEPLRFASGQRGLAFDAALAKAVAARPDTVHMPIAFDGQPGAFCADGFHPSKASYQRFGRQIAQLVAEHLPA